MPVLPRRIHSHAHPTTLLRVIDHIGPLPLDDKGNTHILVMIDAFSR